MRPTLIGAILRKDAWCLLPLVTVVALLFLADALVTRLELLPLWTMYAPAVRLVALLVLVVSVFQLDSPASLTGDWLCRPVRVRELLAAKLLLLAGSIYLPKALGILVADLALGHSLAEAAQDALTLSEPLTPLLLLLFLFVAIITRTFTQAFGVLFVLFLAIFAVPTPFIRPPAPTTTGLRDEWWQSGMAWLATMPAKAVLAMSLAIALWLAYRQRKLLHARIVMVAAVLVSLVLLVTPIALLSWESTFALQRTAAPGSGAMANTPVTLRPLQACFPATRRANLSDGAFDAARRQAGLALWDDESLRDVGPESVAFLTRVEPRGLPLDFRATLDFVEARYSMDADSIAVLRPARYLTDDSSGTFSHVWVLPQSIAAQLARAPRPRLSLRYFFTVLEPRDYAVPVDGRRHALPGLGYCSATRDHTRDEIDVECFSATSPAQISAELADIPATRVAAVRDLAPRWASWPYGKRVHLTIGSPRLSTDDHVTVTAWRVAGHRDERLTLPGILGGDSGSCPLPDGESRFEPGRWSDRAPHQVTMLTVEPGVQLEVLDFGGAGSPVVLLPGLGATAHAYDELAPLLARRHRVIAITRRGAGHSSRPDFGFDTPRLAADVLAVMDQLDLGKVLLVGHSIAGEELTWLGAHHAEHFSGLVYLDAAFDRSREARRSGDAHHQRWRELHRRLPPEPPLPPAAFTDHATLNSWLIRRGHLPYPEGELIAFLNVDKPFLAGTPAIDARTREAILAAVRPPAYEKVELPALALYALPDPARPLPSWVDATDARLVDIAAEIRRMTEATKRDAMAKLKRDMPHAELREIPNAEHYLILSNPRDVLDAVEAFAHRLETQPRSAR